MESGLKLEYIEILNKKRNLFTSYFGMEETAIQKLENLTC